MDRRLFLAECASALTLLGCARPKSRTEIHTLIAQLASNDPNERERAGKALAEAGHAALPELEKTARDHPEADVRRRAGQLVAAIAKWPCSQPTEVRENAGVLHGSEKDFQQAQAKLSWNGNQSKPILTVWFVTEGYWGVACLFPQRLNDAFLHDPVAVTPKEFQRMMAGVKKLVRNAKDWQRKREDIILDVIRRNGQACEGYSFGVPDKARKPFYQALLAGLDPGNVVGRAELAQQRTNVGAGD